MKSGVVIWGHFIKLVLAISDGPLRQEQEVHYLDSWKESCGTLCEKSCRPSLAIYEFWQQKDKKVWQLLSLATSEFGNWRVWQLTCMATLNPSVFTSLIWFWTMEIFCSKMHQFSHVAKLKSLTNLALTKQVSTNTGTRSVAWFLKFLG